jgi:hypothetical protein
MDGIGKKICILDRSLFSRFRRVFFTAEDPHCG